MTSMQLLAEIQPADVYERVMAVERSIAFIMYLMTVVIILVCCQLVAKLAIFKLIANMVKEYLERTNRLLNIIERHAQLTDDQRDTVKNRIEGVHDAVNKVPEATANKTVDKIRDVIPRGDSNPGTQPSLSFWPFTASFILIASGMTVANMPTPSPQNTQEMKVLQVSESSRMYEEGMSFMKRGDYVAAHSLFMKSRYQSVELFKEATAKAAECCLYLGKYDESLYLCNELLDRDPKSGRSYLIRGLVYEARGDKQTAIRCWFDAAGYGDIIAHNKLKTHKLV